MKAVKAPGGFVLSEQYVPDSATLAGDVAGAVGVLGSRSANFASSMSLADILNVGVTAIAANRGDHLMGMPARADGVAIKSDPSNFLSAAALSGGWALTGVVGLSIYIIGNVYVTLHQRLQAHHNAVVSLYKCYGMLLRIENFLKAAEIYCKTYDFQVDSLEIQDDLVNVFRVLDEITTQDDIQKVYTNVKEGRTFTLNSAGANHDQVIASPTQGSPYKSFFTNRGRAIWNSTGAVIHKLMTNVTEWCNRFNSIMIEINMHFTLLTSEFFMLANIHQMKSPTDKNQGFADMMMNATVINEKQNPLWCIKLQIMLAPFLRVRNILFSCALSTNTELCRLTANREMQDIDRTNGFNTTALWAYFKRLFRLYTVEEAKTINVGLFLEILGNAVKNVKDNCYFKSLSADNYIHITVNELSELLKKPNISRNHDLFMKVISLLDEIYKIVLACGRADQHGFIDLTTRQFHSDHFTASRMHSTAERVPSLEETVYVQLSDFSYVNTPAMFSIEDINETVTEMCQRASLNASTLNKLSYDVAAHASESERVIANRIKKMIRPTITTDAAAAAAAAAAATEASAMPSLIQVQLAYNMLYNFVMEFNSNSKGGANIVEQRGRWLAGCILLIERALIGAVILSKQDIDIICEKCKALINFIESHDPDRSLNQIALLFDNASIPILIKKIIKLSTGVKRSAAAAPAAAAPAAAVSISQLARSASGAAAAAPMQLSGLAAPQQPAQMSKSVRTLNAMRSAFDALGKTFKGKSKSTGKGNITDRLLLDDSDGGAGGGRNKLRKTRRFNRNRRTKRLCAHRRLKLNLNRSRSRRSHTQRR